MTLGRRLKEATRTLHAQAERAGVMPALLRGDLPRERYIALLWQLEAIYGALETALEHPQAPAVAPALRRRDALRADLAHLDPRGAPVWLAPTRDYAQRLRTLAPPLLAAHAYVRYLGDLAGGQVLRRIVGRAYGLQQAGLSFYAFDGDPSQLAGGLRQMLDAMPPELGDALVEEACAGFRRHVALFEALAAAARTP